MCIYYLGSSPEFALNDSQTYENSALLKATSLMRRCCTDLTNLRVAMYDLWNIRASYSDVDELQHLAGLDNDAG